VTDGDKSPPLLYDYLSHDMTTVNVGITTDVLSFRGTPLDHYITVEKYNVPYCKKILYLRSPKVLEKILSHRFTTFTTVYYEKALEKPGKHMDTRYGSTYYRLPRVRYHC
jgi:hypothetical protein